VKKREERVRPIGLQEIGTEGGLGAARGLRELTPIWGMHPSAGAGHDPIGLVIRHWV